MKIEIREARIEDVPTIAWTVLAALDLETDHFDRFIEVCSADETLYSWRHSIVACVDGETIGCLIAYDGSRYLEWRDLTWSSLWDDIDPDYVAALEPEAEAGEFYLDSMAIRQEYRRFGIGKLLMQYAVEKGQAQGCASATLLVDEHKPRLKAYYESFGFEAYGIMEFFGHNYYRMRMNYDEVTD